MVPIVSEAPAPWIELREPVLRLPHQVERFHPDQVPRFVTASLKVDYLRPTPLGPRLEVRGAVKEASERKVVVEATVSAEGEVTARGTVVAVRMPEDMLNGGA